MPRWTVTTPAGIKTANNGPLGISILNFLSSWLQVSPNLLMSAFRSQRPEFLALGSIFICWAVEIESKRPGDLGGTRMFAQFTVTDKQSLCIFV